MPPTTRKPTAKKTAAKKTTTPRKQRGPVAPPKPPVLDRDREDVTEGPAPVSDDNATPETEDKPKRGRKPNVVGQANARFQKARTRLEKAQAKADKVQSVQDELTAAKVEFEEAQAEYRDAFTASLTNSVPADDDGDNDE